MKLPLKNIVWKEGDFFVAQCLNVEVSSFGDTKDDADGKTQIDWNKNIEWSGKNKNEALEDIYLKEEDRVWGKKELDLSKLKYDYHWLVV